jgi:hypothetical protein
MTVASRKSFYGQSSDVDLSLSNSLVELAARINAEHETVTKFRKQSLEGAIRAGKLLIEAKAQLKHGGWLPWLREQCQVPERTAQLYMHLARHAPADRNARDSAIAASLALQYGCPLEVLQRAVLRDARGRTSTPLGAALDLLAGGAK